MIGNLAKWRNHVSKRNSASILSIKKSWNEKKNAKTQIWQIEASIKGAWKRLHHESCCCYDSPQPAIKKGYGEGVGDKKSWIHQNYSFWTQIHLFTTCSSSLYQHSLLIRNTFCFEVWYAQIYSKSNCVSKC